MRLCGGLKQDGGSDGDKVGFLDLLLGYEYEGTCQID